MAVTEMALGSEMTMLLDAIEETRILVREDLTVAYANRAFRRRYGIKDATGRRCHEVLFHEVRSCAECGEACPVQKAFVTGVPVREVQHRFVPGGERFVELTATPLLRADGSIACVMETVVEQSGVRGLVDGAGVVAQSEAVRAVLGRIARVCARDTVVLFKGPAGTGKEVFARFLHENSRRAAMGFVKIDCAGLTVESFEREFFGTSRERGLLDTLPGGTVYFDEVAELPLALQVRLLDLIETGRMRESGSGVVRVAGFRILCSSRFDLAQRVREGRFRSDLFYRLGVFTVTIPRLNERREDIAELARLMLRRASPDRPMVLSEDALELLVKRDWPGNVREFLCLLERAVISAEGHRIEASDIETVYPDATNEGSIPLVEFAARWEGSRKALAERLGISERTLYRRLREAQADAFQPEEEKGSR